MNTKELQKEILVKKIQQRENHLSELYQKELKLKKEREILENKIQQLKEYLNNFGQPQRTDLPNQTKSLDAREELLRQTVNFNK